MADGTPFARKLKRSAGRRVRSIMTSARRRALLRRLNRRTIRSRPQQSLTPNEVFGDLDDRSWLWVNTAGYRKSRLIQQVLPGLPPARTQLAYTGDAGDSTLTEGFRVYRLFRELYEESVGEISACQAILDFGCGWGRVIRFFLRDVDPSKLYGVDPSREMIQICRQTNRWSSFFVIEPRPPTSFPPDMFDLIFANSVFSHLSEDVHREWLTEFDRILRPGGLLVATTWPRAFIEAREEQFSHLPEWMQVHRPAFPNPETWLAAYDAGEYVHSRLGHSGSRDYFGETCIPKEYVQRHWTEYFDFVDFIDDRRRCPQDVIVMRS
jgi:SAM-dependent methyltransferase